MLGFPEHTSRAVPSASLFVCENCKGEIFGEIGARSTLDKDLVYNSTQQSDRRRVIGGSGCYGDG